MKKKIFYLIGFITVFTINYLLKDIYDAKQIEELNQLHIISIIDNALSPFGLFLLLKFFFTLTYKFKNFAIIYAIIMTLELSLGYFYGNGHFDYNYLIGCLLGLGCVYILDYTVTKISSDKQQEQAANI
jgi:hypothetical protein